MIKIETIRGEWYGIWDNFIKTLNRKNIKKDQIVKIIEQKDKQSTIVQIQVVYETREEQ